MGAAIQEDIPYTQARVRKTSKTLKTLRLFIQDPKALIGVILFGIFVLIAVFAPLIAPYNPADTQFVPLQTPSAAHWFGTTNTGQDIFSQFIWGAQTSLIVGSVSAVLSTLLSVLVGVYGGLKGGAVDAVLNTLSNIFLVMPGLALLILIEAYMKNTTPIINGFIIALTGWAWGARVFRSAALSIVNRDFIMAARLSGAGSFRIMFAEILPNMVSIISSNLIYGFLGGIMAEAGLAYLGFENISSNSWGIMLFWAQNGGGIMAGSWWWFVPPGLAIAIVGTSLTLMNFAIDQITNPRLKVRKKMAKGSVQGVQ